MAMPEDSGHQIDLERIEHRFGEFVAVRDVALAIGSGEIIALLGPSGCGKTTLLRIVAGFIAQSAGRVLFDGAPVDHLKPNRRGAGIVFQNYALFPHMNVRANVAYGLEAHRWSRDKIARRVEEMLELVQMRAFADRLPRQLSGGQQQRIALARCLATRPKVLLLDEPFGALDKNLRLDMQIEVKRLQRATGITTIMVTHDQEEALSMADRIAVMNKGAIEQVATPTDIYDRPATLFVNQFVGATNLLAGEIVESGPAICRVRLGNGAVIEAAPAPSVPAGRAVWISIRPEHFRVSAAASPDALPATIKTVLPLGAQVAYDVEIAGGEYCKVVLPRAGNAGLIEAGTAVFVSAPSAAACTVFPKQEPATKREEYAT
jgi:putative spermidine/putrescine transport system ATP-binding protein